MLAANGFGGAPSVALGSQPLRLYLLKAPTAQRGPAATLTRSFQRGASPLALPALHWSATGGQVRGRIAWATLPVLFALWGAWLVTSPSLQVPVPEEPAGPVGAVPRGDVGQRDDVLQAAPIASPQTGEHTLPELDHREAEALARIQTLATAGEITDAEARHLERATVTTFDDARVLVERFQRGEIYWLGGMVRSVPLRIRHVSQVVDTLGYDRAQAFGHRRMTGDEEQASSGNIE